MAEQISEEVNIDVKVNKALEGIKKLGDSLGGVNKQLTQILDHFDKLNSKTLGNVTKNIQQHTTKVTTSKTNDIYAIGETVMSVRHDSRTKQTKEAMAQVNAALQTEAELKKQILETEKETTRLTAEKANHLKEITRLEQQEADTRKRNADARYATAEYKNSEEHRSYDKALAGKHERLQGFYDFKSAHPEMFATGYQLRSARFQMGNALRNVGGTIGGIGVGSDKLEGRVFGGVLNAFGALLRSPWAGAAAGVTSLARGIKDLGVTATQAYAEIEATKTQLGVVFSNQTQADSMFGEISKYAVKSPFGIQQTSELAILLKQSGVYASDLMDTLRMLGDTAGGNMEKMKRIANNYAQIMAIGKASMLDMRQFAYAGIPIFEAVSKELNVSQQELRKLISDGKVTSDIIEKVFKDLTGINGLFENATEKGAKTLKARLQNLADAKQLALGEVGQWAINIGSKTGNDGLAMKLVDTAENIYQWLQENVKKDNLETAKDNIIANEQTIKALERLIEYNKEWGTPDVVKGLEKLLAIEKAKFDEDKKRATYTEMYHSKFDSYNSFVEKGDVIDPRDIQQKIQRLQGILTNAYTSKGVGNASLLGGGTPAMGLDSLGKVLLANKTVKDNPELKAIQEQIKYYQEILSAMKEYKGIFEELRDAAKESATLEAQQTSVDATNNYAKQTDSLNSGFEELYSILRESDEEKKKQEEARLERLKSVQNELKKIREHTDKDGNVSLSSFGLKEILALNEKGAFKANKIDLTSTDKKVQGESRFQLETNLDWFINQFKGEFLKNPNINYSTSGKAAYESVLNSYSKLNMQMTDKEFIKQYNKTNAEINNSLNNLVKAVPDSAEFVEAMKKGLGLTSSNLSAGIGGLDADLSSVLSGTKNLHIPLWKRILSSQTGLTTQGMTGTKQTMENYRDDMAIRNLASGVLKATFSSMNAETARSLMRTTGTSKVLRYDAGGNPVYQIDWAETKNAIHDFAMQLSASTEVIEAYKAGLESELNAYQELMALGFTEAESADLNQQKTVSAKKFEQFAKDAGEQLVTAFGEGLETVNGEAIGYDKKNQKFVDEKGNEIALEQVRITGNLFKFIQNEMPRLRHEIAESVSKEQNNKALSSIYSNIQATAMSQQLANSIGMNKASGFALLNPDYMKAIFDSQLTSIKSTPSYNSKYGGMSNQDIHLAAMQGDSGAIALIDEVFRKIEEAAKELVNSPAFQELEKQTKNQKKQNQINAAVLKASGNGELKPDEYRGFWSHLGYDKAYTTEEVTAAYVRANPTYNYSSDGMVTKSYMGGLSEADIDKMSDKEIYEKLGLKERYEISLAINAEEAGERINKLKDDIGNLGVDTLANGINSSMEILGQHLRDASDASGDLGQNFAAIASGLASNLGQLLTQAGLWMIIGSMGNPASPQFWAGVALAAAGAGSSFLAGLSKTDNSNDKKTEDKTKKLENLKNDLLDLLKQAREDAVYYENTLRHKKALSTNDSISEVKVNDAIITPQGNVISTHPDDYLIATKTPHTLLSGSNSPTINFSLVDKSTGVQVTQQKTKYNEDTNTIEVEAVIESKVKEIIASSAGDEAFAAREARLSGRHVLT